MDKLEAIKSKLREMAKGCKDTKAKNCEECVYMKREICQECVYTIESNCEICDYYEKCVKVSQVDKPNKILKIIENCEKLLNA